MKIVLISPSASSIENMTLVLEDGDPSRVVVGHEGGISKLRALAEQERPEVMIVEGLCRDPGELAPIDFVTASFPQMIIILLCSQHTPEYLIHAMRAGVREVLPSPVSAAALDAAVVRAEAKLGLLGIHRNARVIAFISCKGGGGATFLATNLGYQLAGQGKRILLIDLNLQFGEALLTVHDRKATSDIAEVARNLSRLDAAYLSASTVQVAPHYQILAAPEDPASSLEIKADHLEAILAVAVKQYDFVVLDLSRILDELTIKALDRAHSVFLVLQTSLPHIRNAKRMIDLFNSLGYPQDKIELLVNRFERKSEITLRDLRGTLDAHRMRTIPNSYAEVSKAVNQGRSLGTASRSNVVFKAIAELAESLLPKPEEVRGGLFGRLLRR